MTTAQAAAEYVSIITPSDNAGDVIDADINAGVPTVVSWSKLWTDYQAYDQSLTKAGQELLAQHWPANVEPWVQAMIADEFSAIHQCYLAEKATGDNLTAYNNVETTDASCTDESNNDDAVRIRTLLNLPNPSS